MVRKLYKVLCHACDAVVDVPFSHKNSRLLCPICKTQLHSSQKSSLYNLAVVSIAAVILLLTCVSLPFLSISAMGISQSMSLMSIIYTLKYEWYILLYLCLVLTFFCPLFMHLIVISIVLLHIKVTRSIANVYAFCHLLSMVEVFIVGVLVSLIKLMALAQVEFYVGFYVAFLYTILMVWCYSQGHPYRIWKLVDIEPVAVPTHAALPTALPTAPLQTKAIAVTPSTSTATAHAVTPSTSTAPSFAMSLAWRRVLIKSPNMIHMSSGLANAHPGKRGIEQGIILCRHCSMVYPIKISSQEEAAKIRQKSDTRTQLARETVFNSASEARKTSAARQTRATRKDKLMYACPRCHRYNGFRVVHMYQKTISLLLAAIIMYLPSNLYPIMFTDYLGNDVGSNIIDGVISLWGMHSYFVALVILVASIFIPLLKIICILVLLYLSRYGHVINPSRFNRLYRAVVFIGRWSMIDVFVVVIMSTVVRISGFLTINPGLAILCFSMVVIITMLAAEDFDERILWDRSAKLRQERRELFLRNKEEQTKASFMSRLNSGADFSSSTGLSSNTGLSASAEGNASAMGSASASTPLVE